jgi:hypothetical protein
VRGRRGGESQRRDGEGEDQRRPNSQSRSETATESRIEVASGK